MWRRRWSGQRIVRCRKVLEIRRIWEGPDDDFVEKEAAGKAKEANQE